MPCYSLHRRWNLSINVRDRSFVSIIVLENCFRVCIFLTFCYLSWAKLRDVAFSDYYESILSHFGFRLFKISTKLLAVIVAQ